MEDLNDAQVFLLAAQLVSTLELSKFRFLAARRQDVLTQPIILRILLTYLPLEFDAEIEQALVQLLKDVDQRFSNFSDLDHVLPTDSEIPDPSIAESSLSDLVLEKIPFYGLQSDSDVFCDFIVAWIHKLEEFGSISDFVMNMIDTFADQHPGLRSWTNTYLWPLYKLQNDLYPSQASSLTLNDLESNEGIAGVDMLMSFSTSSGEPSNIARDLNEVVTPWVKGATRSKRRKLDSTEDKNLAVTSTSWDDVNDWLISTSRKDYQATAATVEQWNGPPVSSLPDDAPESQQRRDHEVAYIQTILALIYISSGYDDAKRISTKKALSTRATNLAQLMPPDFSNPLPDIPDITSLKTSSRVDLLDNALLRRGNILTTPSTSVVDFLLGVLSTQSLLDGFKIETSTHSIASKVLFGTEEQQKQDFQNIINQIPRLTRSNFSWHDLRNQLLWLQAWSTSHNSAERQSLTYLGHIPTDFLETSILDAMLAAGEYDSIKNIYLAPAHPVLSLDSVKAQVLQAVYNAYDNASNGNRNRGGVKRASDILKAFTSSFPSSREFTNIEHLIRATHSLSFYQLTLQYGVPFQPVSIRVSSDPLSLVGKALEQNHKAYTKLDDLLSVARNLVLADLPMPSRSSDFAPGEVIPIDRRLFDAEHRVTYLAITAALADHDFDTAYSLITTRLTASNSRESTPFADNTTWQAAYAAGKYRPQQTPPNLHARIAFLKKQMDLISTALTLAPTSEPLPEILSTWRRCEEEMDSLKAEALSEERSREETTDTALPGDFGPSDRDLDSNETKRLVESRRAQNATVPSYEEEAPLGLFDVARGAASALRKNAFPLRGANAKDIQVRSRPQLGADYDTRSSDELQRPGSSDGQRVRKRDMISNAVTGTVVGGLSWVLGAQPAEHQRQSQ